MFTNLKIVIVDWFLSVKSNFKQIGFNRSFLIPYGIFRIIIIFFLTVGWLSAALIPATDQFYYVDKIDFWPGIARPLGAPIIQPRDIYDNAQLRAGYLAINLIAWFLSLFILALGLANVINFPSFSKRCNWLLQFLISDIFFGICLLIVSLLCIFRESSLDSYWYDRIYRKNAFMVAGATGIAACISYIVSIIWSIIELYKLRKDKIEKRLDLELDSSSKY